MSIVSGYSSRLPAVRLPRAFLCFLFLLLMMTVDTLPGRAQGAYEEQQAQFASRARRVVTARIGETIEVYTSDEAGAALISVTDARPIFWNTVLTSTNTPPWLWAYQSLGRLSSPFERWLRQPLLQVSVVKWELHRLTDQDVDPESVNRLRTPLRIAVSNEGQTYGEFTAILRARAEWFIAVDPGDLLVIPRRDAPRSILHLRVKFGANYNARDVDQERYVVQWPPWASCRIAGGESLIAFQPQQSQVVGNTYMLAYSRAPGINEFTRLDQPVTVEVYANEHLPAWHNRVLAQFRFPRVYDPDGIAGTAPPPTDTPEPSYMRIVITGPTDSPTPSPTRTRAPATPTLTPTPIRPVPTLAPMYQSRLLAVFKDGRRLDLGGRLEFDGRSAAPQQVVVQLPRRMRAADEPLAVRDRPIWLDEPEIAYAAPEATTAAVTLRPQWTTAVADALMPGQAEMDGTLTIGPSSPAIDLAPARVAVRLVGLSWSLRSSPPVAHFADPQQTQLEITLELMCLGLPVVIPNDAELALIFDEQNAWVPAALKLEPAFVGTRSTNVRLLLDPQYWPAEQTSASCRVRLTWGGRIVAETPLPIQYRPAGLHRTRRFPVVSNVVVAATGGALLVLLAALYVLLRRPSGPTEETTRDAELEQPAPVALDDLDFGDEPFADLPPEENEDEGGLHQAQSLTTSSASGGSGSAGDWPAISDPFGPPPVSASTAAEAIPADPFAPPAMTATPVVAESALRNQIRQALERLEIPEGDQSVSAKQLDQIADELFARMRPLVDRVERVERAVGRGSTPAVGGVVPVPQEGDAALRAEVAALRQALNVAQQRLEQLEQTAKTASGPADETLTQLQQDVTAARELVGSFDQRVQRAIQTSQPMQNVWTELAALRQLIQPTTTAGAPVPVSAAAHPDDLAAQVADLARCVESHFRQQIRFQARQILASLPSHLGPFQVLAHLDRFAPEPRLDDLRKSSVTRVELAREVINLLATFVVTDDSEPARLFREAANQVRSSGFLEAARVGTPDLASEAVVKLRALLEQLRDPIAAHRVQVRDEHSDPWLAGEALRLLAGILECWLADVGSPR